MSAAQISAGCAIHTPKSLWSKAIERNKAEARKPDGRPDAFVFFVGSRRGGKSTLLNRFLYPDRAGVAKPSEGLEYTYARRAREHDHEKKDIAHIWELGGGDELATKLANVDNVFLTAKQVTTAVVVIVADLSEPAAVLGTVQKWLDVVKGRLASTYQRLEQRGSKLPEQLRVRAKKALYASNEDRDAVHHSGISLLIAATKYDAFARQEPELQKIMARTLRHISHVNGAHLVYLGQLHGNQAPSEASSLSTNPKAMLENFRRLLNHLTFTGLEKKISLKSAPQTDHLQALLISAGTDCLKDIGWPRDSAGIVVSGPGAQKLLKDAFESAFPQKPSEQRPDFTIDEKYKEEGTDSVLGASQISHLS
eukprot:evm.model.scf_672.3 EVM.evm.TU.scf_672.3   scf_672:14722-17919(-)